jgi:hypothetical protein
VSWRQPLPFVPAPIAVLAVEPGHLGELVKDPLLLILTCRPTPSGDGLDQFFSACQTQLPPSFVARHLQDSRVTFS